MKKRTPFILVSVLAVVGFLLFLYAWRVEPFWIEVTRYSIKTEISKRLKIAHLSDLHIRSLGSRESKIHAILHLEKPDVILITGDSIAENGNYEALGSFLEIIQVPLGVWLVNGNWEHWRPDEKELKVYEAAGVKLLNNSAAELTAGVWVVGIDDEVGNPDLARALIGVPEKAFKIGLFHSPAFFDRSQNHFDLALAGHTHGGQVRLPFFPPLWLPEGSGRFISGWYKGGDTQMYVSRGLGNSILDIRFGSRPELPIIEVGP
jgi:uncharacterized protein